MVERMNNSQFSYLKYVDDISTKQHDIIVKLCKPMRRVWALLTGIELQDENQRYKVTHPNGQSERVVIS